MVSWVVTGFLDDVSLEYKIQTITDPGDTTSQLYDALLVHQQTDPKSIYLNQSSWWWQYDLIFLCYWGSGNATNINRNFSSIGSPISDKSTLNKIQVDLKRYMAQGVESLAGLGIPEATRGLIALSQENPLNSDTPFVDHPITNFPTGAPTWGTGAPSMPAASSDLKNLAVENTYSKPIDPLLWVRQVSDALHKMFE